MNLRPVKPCAVIKGSRWLKNIVSILGNSYYPRNNPLNAPEY